MNTLNNTYKVLAGDPTLEVTNVSGSAYVSSTGTPTRRGIWQVRIQAGTGSALEANVIEVECASETRRVPVFNSGSFITIVPGLIITLGTIAAGNYFDVKYSKLVADTV